MFFVLSKYLSKETFNVLASYYSWADRFESHFCIIIPRQGFRDGAHLLTPSTTKKIILSLGLYSVVYRFAISRVLCHFI